MNQAVIINRIRNAREALQAAGVRHAYLFGSVARGEADARSDVENGTPFLPSQDAMLTTRP